MKKGEARNILILLVSSLVITIVLSFLLTDITNKVSQDYIEFLIGLSITMAGFGLVAFQVTKASNALRKDFIESSIFLLISSLFGLFYWADRQMIWLAIASSFFFL